MRIYVENAYSKPEVGPYVVCYFGVQEIDVVIYREYYETPDRDTDLPDPDKKVYVPFVREFEYLKAKWDRETNELIEYPEYLEEFKDDPYLLHSMTIKEKLSELNTAFLDYQRAQSADIKQLQTEVETLKGNEI